VRASDRGCRESGGGLRAARTRWLADLAFQQVSALGQPELPLQRQVRIGPPRPGSVPGSRPLPRAGPRSSAQSAGFGCFLPVGGVVGLAELPSSEAGWAAVPGAGPGLFSTSPSLLGARAPCGGPVPPPIGDHWAASRRVPPRDRRDRDMSCRGAAQVPGPLIKTVVGGSREWHHSQLRTYPAGTGSSWTGLGQVGNGCPADHNIRGFVLNRSTFGAEGGLGIGDPLRVSPPVRGGAESLEPGTARPPQPGLRGGAQGGSDGGAPRRGVLAHPCPVTPPD
jgi:hypothetical protein